MKCNKCGAEIPVGSKFCGECGNKIETESNQDDDKAFAFLCPICKTPNPKTVKYCVNCGHWLLDSNFEAIPVSEQQYYKIINSKGKKNPYKASCTSPKKKINIAIPIIIYAFYLIMLIIVPLAFKVFLALLIIPYGIVNICIPLRKMLISKRFIGIIIAVFGLVLSICLLSNYSPVGVAGVADTNSSSAITTGAASNISSSAATTGTADSASSAVVDINKYKTQCQSILYSDLAHSTEKYINNKVAVTGQVIQVEESDNSVILRVNITKDDYGIYKDTIWVNYTMKPGDSHIIENDIINIWGSVDGRKTYSTVLGSSVTIPEIDAVDIEENK